MEIAGASEIAFWCFDIAGPLVAPFEFAPPPAQPQPSIRVLCRTASCRTNPSLRAVRILPESGGQKASRVPLPQLVKHFARWSANDLARFNFFRTTIELF